jgi:hypothetical protein
MSLVSINDVLKITTRVEKIHPYKVVGDRDSYSPYNEGWSDCVSLIEHYLEQLPSAEPEWKIIYCKDCKFYTPMNRKLKTGICSLTMHHLGDDGFCSDAERRGRNGKA